MGLVTTPGTAPTNPDDWFARVRNRVHAAHGFWESCAAVLDTSDNAFTNALADLIAQDPLMLLSPTAPDPDYPRRFAKAQIEINALVGAVRTGSGSTAVDLVRSALGLVPGKVATYRDVVAQLSGTIGMPTGSQRPIAAVAALDALDADARSMLVGEDPDGADLATELAHAGVTVPAAIVAAVAHADDVLGAVDADLAPTHPMIAPADAGADGTLVHALIQCDYAISRPGHVVIYDWMYQGPGAGPMGFGRFSQMSAATLGPVVTRIRALLTNAASSVIARPDILDLTTGEAWEIKPVGQTSRALPQLVTRTLLPINTGFHSAATASWLANNMSAAGGVPAGAPGIVPDAPIIVPGYSWIVPSFYLLRGGKAVVAHQPRPGVITYRIFARPDWDGDAETYQELADQFATLREIAAFARAAIAGGKTLEEVGELAPTLIRWITALAELAEV